MSEKKAFVLRIIFDDSADIEYALSVLKLWSERIADKNKKYGFVRRGQHTGFLFITTSKPLATLTSTQVINNLKTLITTNPEIQIVESTDPAT